MILHNVKVTYFSIDKQRYPSPFVKQNVFQSKDIFISFYVTMQCLFILLCKLGMKANNMHVVSLLPFHAVHVVY